MFVLIVELEAKPGKTGELESLLRNLVQLAEKEPGTLFYGVQQLQDNPEQFILCEYYADKNAWETHMQYESVQKNIHSLTHTLKGEPKIRFCDALATTPL